MQRRKFVTSGLGSLAASSVLLPTASLGATPQQPSTDEAHVHGHRRTIIWEVANDLRRFVVNGSRTLMEARRGDGFITEGKIFRAGTIPPGGTMTQPGPFNPDTTPGAIGLWHCRGTFVFDFADILNGAEPHVMATQFLLFNDGSGLITDGPEGGPVMRSLVGGIGGFVGAVASVREDPIGTNMTGLFNVRFTFDFQKRG